MRDRFTITLLLEIALFPLLIGCGSTCSTGPGSSNATDKVTDKPTSDKPVEIDSSDKVYIDYVFQGGELYGNKKYKDRVVLFPYPDVSIFKDKVVKEGNRIGFTYSGLEKNGPVVICELSPEGAKQYLDHEAEIKDGTWRIQGVCRGLKSETKGNYTVQMSDCKFIKP
jgi:hypothetical protein